jgi:hypothetical protein
VVQKRKKKIFIIKFIVLKRIEICFYLLCFRSSNRGNFLEILKWAAQTDPIVQSIFQDSTSNATYLSHDIQNELIHIMSSQIREDIAFMVICIF